MVYLADDPDLNRQVAIKTLTQGSHDRAKLLHEARSVAGLDHPNIVTLFEIDLDHRPPYMVYQFVAGEPLDQFAAPERKMSVHRILAVMVRVLDGIRYAHQRDILHRDLTPANILVDADDNPRILDFGISTALTGATASSELNGTASYMAPEVLAEQTPGPASDLFSLSMVLHELLTGQRLFKAPSPLALIYMIINEHVQPPSQLCQGVDNALDQVVMKGLEKDPARRYQSAAEMRDAIGAYLAPSQSKTPTSASAKGAIEFLQRRMARKPDFPAISQHVSEINQKSGIRDGADADADDLASVILKDYALTTKLLKVVNSAVHGHYGGSISTVSRAVIILGFEQIRAIALGLIIFEHLKDGEQAGKLKEASCSSFLSAMLARELSAQQNPALNSEEAFIGAMFHRLGRHLAIYYFPDEYAEVLQVMESKACSESAAAREIFGCDFYQFGTAIGREWNLPEHLLMAMRPQSSGMVKAGSTPENLVPQVCAFSNEVAETLAGDPNDSAARIENLLVRYESCFKLDAAPLKGAVSNAIAATREYASVINIELDSTQFLKRVKRAVTDESKTPGRTSMGRVSEQPTTAADAEPNSAQAADIGQRRHVFLTNAISELTTAILDDSSINGMISLVLEAFYRSLDFSHVLFMMRDTRQNAYVTRVAFGDEVETMRAQFIYTVSSDIDIFNHATRKGRNAVIIDAADSSHGDLIPAWVRALNTPQSILIFSVVVKKVCIGLIYADTRDQALQINAQELKLLNTLVKQHVLGFQQH